MRCHRDRWAHAGQSDSAATAAIHMGRDQLVHTYDWEWDCYQGEGVPKVWAPAHSVAYYTPQPDGTLTGSRRTDIDSGPCEGSQLLLIYLILSISL